MNKKTISKKEVEKTAGLARLDLTDQEIEKFSKQLADVISNFSQVDEIETSDIKITAQVTGKRDVLEPDNDKMRIDITREELLINAPKKGDGFFIVPRVL